MKKIKLIKIGKEKYIYINRGINNFLFTQQELNVAKERFEMYKNFEKK